MPNSGELLKDLYTSYKQGLQLPQYPTAPTLPEIPSLQPMPTTQVNTDTTTQGDIYKGLLSGANGLKPALQAIANADKQTYMSPAATFESYDQNYPSLVGGKPTGFQQVSSAMNNFITRAGIGDMARRNLEVQKQTLQDLAAELYNKRLLEAQIWQQQQAAQRQAVMDSNQQMIDLYNMQTGRTMDQYGLQTGLIDQQRTDIQNNDTRSLGLAKDLYGIQYGLEHPARSGGSETSDYNWAADPEFLKLFNLGQQQNQQNQQGQVIEYYDDRTGEVLGWEDPNNAQSTASPSQLQKIKANSAPSAQPNMSVAPQAQPNMSVMQPNMSVAPNMSPLPMSVKR